MDLPVGTILEAALPVFLLLLLGYALRRGRVLTAEADSSLMKLVIRVFYPCLYLDFIIGNPALKGAANILTAPVVGFFTTAGGFLVAYGVARAIGLKRGEGLRTFTFSNGIYNYGYIPIPLILALFPGRETAGVLLVHNVGVEVAVWTVGILLLVGRFERGMLRKLINPPLLALGVALFVNGTGLDGAVPDWLGSLVGMLGACSVPIGIILAGASIADLLNWQQMRELPRVPLASIGVRLALLPALFLAAAAFLPGISTELRQVIIVQAAMPAGIFPIVLSRHYGGDAGVAVKVVLATTLACVVTMPLWLRLGTAFVF
ncbi:MAG: AEC family transporter [Oceanipulchritudo sp.]|jgi:predicted permease